MSRSTEAIPVFRSSGRQDVKFNIYGRFQGDVRREDELWVVYRVEPGKRARLDDIVIPSGIAADEVAVYLDDLFHEFAGIGQSVEPI